MEVTAFSCRLCESVTDYQFCNCMSYLGLNCEHSGEEVKFVALLTDPLSHDFASYVL